MNLYKAEAVSENEAAFYFYSRLNQVFSFNDVNLLKGFNI